MWCWIAVVAGVVEPAVDLVGDAGGCENLGPGRPDPLSDSKYRVYQGGSDMDAGSGLLEVQRPGDRDYVGVFGVHVEQADVMAYLDAVEHAFLDDDRMEVVREGVGDRGPDASAGRGAGDQDRVGPEVDQISGQSRPKKALACRLGSSTSSSRGRSLR